MRTNASLTCPNSVGVERRNLRRTGVLKNSVRTSIDGPDRTTAGHDRACARRRSPPTPPRPGCPACGCGSPSGSPRQSRPGPRRGTRACRTRKRSSALAILLVAWLATARGRSSGSMPQPLSTTRISSTPAGLDRHVDPRRPGVHRVLHQLLDHARRALDHLPGGDLVDEALRKLVDAGHGQAKRGGWKSENRGTQTVNGRRTRSTRESRIHASYGTIRGRGRRTTEPNPPAPSPRPTAPHNPHPTPYTPSASDTACARRCRASWPLPRGCRRSRAGSPG